MISSLRSPKVPSPTSLPTFSPKASGSSSAFSHGFRRLLAVGSVARSGSTVGGISLMPGMGRPLWIRETTEAKVEGYCGLVVVVVDGVEVGARLFAESEVEGCSVRFVDWLAGRHADGLSDRTWTL